jgi:hypothetical protein
MITLLYRRVYIEVVTTESLDSRESVDNMLFQQRRLADAYRDRAIACRGPRRNAWTDRRWSGPDTGR